MRPGDNIRLVRERYVKTAIENRSYDAFQDQILFLALVHPHQWLVKHTKLYGLL